MHHVEPPPDAVVWPETTPLLHVIAQGAWHDPAFIGGNRAGIETLRDACNLALAGYPLPTYDAHVFARDGEGYRAVVRVLTNAEIDAMPFGYTDEMARQSEHWPDWMRTWG